MKVLIVDNNPQNRKLMNAQLRDQGIVIIEGLLEAPNRIMGAMLIEAIDFDLVILGGGLDNILPDGSTDIGDGISLAQQVLKKNPATNVVFWSDNSRLQAKFNEVPELYKGGEMPYFSWQKSISLSDIEYNLGRMSQYYMRNNTNTDVLLTLNRG